MRDGGLFLPIAQCNRKILSSQCTRSYSATIFFHTLLQEELTNHLPHTTRCTILTDLVVTTLLISHPSNSNRWLGSVTGHYLMCMFPYSLVVLGEARPPSTSSSSSTQRRFSSLPSHPPRSPSRSSPQDTEPHLVWV